MWKYIKLNRVFIVSLLASALVFVVVQFMFLSSRVADPDAFYHARMAGMVGKVASLHAFPWLPYTTWGSHFADQHFLYHLFLRLFPGFLGLQISIVLLGVLFVAVFIYLLRSLNVRAPWLWLIILLFGSADFLYRINLVKATPVALLFLLAAVILIIRKQWVWLGTLSAVFVLSYGGFVFLFPVAIAYCVVESFRNRKLEYAALATVLVGSALGVMFHPQSRELLPHLYDQFFRAGLGKGMGIPVGREWASYTLRSFFSLNYLIFIPWLAALALFVKRIRTPQRYSWWFMLCSVAFFILTLTSRRFVEYWVPFATLFAAYELSPYLAGITSQKLRDALRRHLIVWLPLVLIVAFIIFGTYQSLTTVRNYMQQSTAPDTYKNAAQWLTAHSNPGDIVFNTQWDQFPQLFYWDTTNYYIIGMDPTFMYLKDPAKYWQWRALSDDAPNTWGDPTEFASRMKQEFNARYIFIELNRNPNLADYLVNASGPTDRFELEYSDALIKVYGLR